MESDMMNPKVSVIIPVYNIQEYIRQSIESVIRQTLLEIEIILIDDGSTDGSGSICDEYANKDKRIKVVHKANQGLSCARNAGIDISTAPYIMFVDGDDWVVPDYCKIPYEIASQGDFDLVLYKHNCVYSNGVYTNSNMIQEGHLNEEEALFNNLFKSNAAWLALYKRDLFDYNRFPEGRLYEDLGLVHRLIHEAHNIYYVDKALYNHRMGRQGSITTDPQTINHHDYIDMYEVRIRDLINWGYNEYAYKLAFSVLIKYGTREDYFFNVIKNAHIISSNSMKQRMMYRVINSSPKLFDYLCIITGRRERTKH